MHVEVGDLDVSSHNRIGVFRGEPRGRPAGAARGAGVAAAGRPCAAPALPSSAVLLSLSVAPVHSTAWDLALCVYLFLSLPCHQQREMAPPRRLALLLALLLLPMAHGDAVGAGQLIANPSFVRTYPRKPPISLSVCVSVSLCLSVYTVGHGAFLPGAGMQNWTVHCPNPALCPRFAAGTEAVGWQQPYSLLSHLSLQLHIN